MERILGAFASHDGEWRIEAVTERRQYWYRLWYGDRLFADRLSVGAVEWELQRHGLTMADFTEVSVPPTT